MEICNSILHHKGNASDEDFIELSYDERFLRRKKLTSYNGIEFFVDLGLANKIESLNAYIGCPFPSSQRSYIFLICENCKNVAEVSTGSVDNSLALIMEKLKFKLRKQQIEVSGICSKCSP